jgi:hypothetical protein
MGHVDGDDVMTIDATLVALDALRRLATTVSPKPRT